MMIRFDVVLDRITKVKLNRLEMLAILCEDVTTTIDCEREMQEELGEPCKHSRKLLKRIRKAALTGYSEGGYVKGGGYSSLAIKSASANMNLYIEFIPVRDVDNGHDDDGMKIIVFNDDDTDEILYESFWDIQLLVAEGLLKDAD